MGQRKKAHIRAVIHAKDALDRPQQTKLLDTITMVAAQAQFGAAVLGILERHEEWSSDTLDEINSVAQGMGLAGLDNGGNFIAHK